MSFMIMPEAVQVIFFSGLSLVGIYKVIVDSGKRRVVSKGLLILCILPIFFLISTLFSSNIQVGFSLFSKVLLLIIVPLPFLIFFKNFISALDLFHGMVVAFFLGMLKLLLSVIQIDFKTVNSFWELRTLIETTSDIHSTYWGLFFGYIIIVFTYYLVNGDYKSYNLAICSILITSFLILIGLNTKMPLIGTILFVFYILWDKFKRNTVVVIYSILIFIVIAVVVYSVPYLHKRYFNEPAKFLTTLEYPSGIYNINHKDISSLSVRYAIYTCDYELFFAKPFLGYGVGDVQSQLDECYFTKFNTNLFSLKRYNSHNQYMDFLLSAGIIGLLVFLYFITKLCSYSISNKNFIGVYLILFTCFIMLTENILHRHYGNMIFAIFLGSHILIFKKEN